MRWLIALGLMGLLLGLLMWQFPNALGRDGERFHLAYLSAWLLPMLAGSALLRKDKLPQSLKYLAVWVLIALALVLGYSFKGEIMSSRFMAELVPHRAQVGKGGVISVRAAEDGHFHLEVLVNDAPIRFMVDTGASDIMLTPQDARRAGFFPANLKYTRTYNTASGTVGGAPVVLASVRVGNVQLNDVPASVNQAETDQSLLGLAFLRLFSSYTVQGSVLTLVP